MGTMLQQKRLSEADYRGDLLKNHSRDLKGNNDLLVLTQPAVVEAVHLAYFEAGSDIVETNTFNGTSIAQEEYGLGHLVREINTAAVAVARKAEGPR